ncbi:MAG: PilN domain-containing protein [Chloroflexi bacterium]|nr:PilN domain-containing protein [Chloroflexota bacterium]
MAVNSRMLGEKNKQLPNEDAVDKLLAPQAAEPEKLSQTTKIMLMAAVSMLVFFLPLFLLTTAVNEDVKGMNTDLGFVRTSLTQVPTPIPAIQKYMTPIAQTQGQINQFNVVYPTLTSPRADWSLVMTAIGKYDPTQISLVAISRTATSVTITGNAINDNVITAYAQSLEQSNVFSRVVVQSFHAVAVTPTVAITKTTTAITQTTPIATPVPTKTPFPKLVFPTSVPITSSAPIQPSATPDFRDAYEADENQPKPIAMSQSQSHNFYPGGDVDAVYFLAKMGRSYHIHTTGLAPGVDTYLTVRSGALLLTNDDATPGSLYSEIYYQHLGADTAATVWISNRASFGADKTYSIIVEEYTPTPTPVPTGTATPTATRTRIPPSSPTPSATPTRDMRDPYEPDDTDATAKTILIGETQSHNFYPSGDMDKVTFPVKMSRYYQVLTSNLALGVDTFVAVNPGDNSTWSNDDHTPGSGNFASAVCFQATKDGMAIATVSNKSGQYNSDKTYQVRVSEVPNLYTAPCAQPTPTVTPSKVSRNSGKVPGLAAYIGWRDRSGEDANDPAVAATMIQFIITAEIKVPAP